MANINDITLDLQFDKTTLKKAEMKISDTVGNLQKVADNLSTSIENTFASNTDGIQNLINWVSLLSSLTACTTLELHNLITLLTEQHEESMWSNFYSQGIESLSLMVDLYAIYQSMLALSGALTIAGAAQSGAWTVLNAIQTVSIAITKTLGNVMTFLTSPIGLVVLAVGALIAIVVLLVKNWDAVKAAAVSAWETVMNALSTAAAWVNEHVLQPIVGFFTNAFAKIGEFLKGVFAKDWTEQFGAFGNVLNAFFANIQNIWNAVKSIFSGIVSFVKNVFAGDWGAAWDSIVQVFKGIWEYLVAVVKAPINGIIGMINALVGGVVSGINIVINALNKLKIDIPDWVPGLGGKSFGFDITPLTAPKIPLLAQGAVLPANKPFLAVVGDQKSGVNVEAPLDTIKQAVAEVLAGQGGGDVVIKFTGDLAQLARVLKPAIDRENRRVGGSLAKGVV